MRLAFRTSLLVLAILLAGGAANLALFVWGPSHFGDYHTLVVDGQAREYLLHVPPSLDAAAPVPLVVALHPLGGWSHQFARVSQWTALADQEGFIVVFPDAQGPIRHIGQGWNAGHCCGYGFERGVDDVAFLDALLDELLTGYPVDPARIYMAGHSNGAMMAYHYGALRAHQLAAIGVVAGAVASGPDAGSAIWTPEPVAPLSVAIVHGTNDQVVPFAGGAQDDGSGWWFAPVASAVEFWRVAADADDEGRVSELPDGSPQVAYHGTEASVLFAAIEGAGHGWPGGLGNPLRPAPNGQVHATDLLWSFFEGRHSKVVEAQAP